MNRETRYAKTRDGVYIAYQAHGDAPVDLVYVPGYASNVEYNWASPVYTRFLERLESISRLIVMDRRGTGLSDRGSSEQLPSLEVMMDDVGVVMDAVGSERAVLFGWANGGHMCGLFAATHPERTVACVLLNTSARGSAEPDYPWQPSREEWDEHLGTLADRWGTAGFFDERIRRAAPSLAQDEAYRNWAGAYLRMAASPSAAVALETIGRDTDIRQVLPSIHVPTLVLHRIDNSVEDVAGSRYIAQHIPGARYVELPGADHLPWAGDQERLVKEITEFLASVRDEEAEFDRVLATVMFTDIVGSTERAAQMGDQRWRGVLKEHDQIVRGLLDRFRGREIKTLGDGFLATFDGPARAIRCATAIAGHVHRTGIDVRAGLHTGELELADNDIRGTAVNIAARVAGEAEPSETLVSSTVKDLVAGSGLHFSDRGIHTLKGVPEPWHLYAASPN